MSLTFSPKTHRYRLDGLEVPSVTGLIKGGIPSPSLMYWSARTVAEYVADNPSDVEQLRSMGRSPMVAALKSVPWEKRDAAALKGTDIHSLAERVVSGEDVDVPAEYLPHVQGYTDFLDRFGVRPVLTECSVAHRGHWYAGRFDLIADIGPDRWMLDAKTGSGIYPEAAVQTDAYRNAEFYVTDDAPDVEYPMPEGITRLGALHITDAGTTLIPLRSDGEPFRDFLHAAYIAKRDKQRKGYVLAPITEPLHEGTAA